MKHLVICGLSTTFGTDIRRRKTDVAGMINCMRFQPKKGQAEALFKAFAEYVRDYPFDDIMHQIIDLVLENLL